jgi:hypothetical protein
MTVMQLRRITPAADRPAGVRLQTVPSILRMGSQRAQHGGRPRRQFYLAPVAPQLARARIEPEPIERELPKRVHARRSPWISRKFPGVFSVLSR